ncbi:MAG: NFACT RNA binding domain-containing protein, partial [Prochlorococcaceae cyanobacterium]
MAALQSLDATALRGVLAELRSVLLPSRFEKAQQGEGRSVQLALRGLAGSHWLELSWLPEAPRLLAIPAPPRQGEGSTLARQLQHSLRGLALTELEQAGPWERIVSLSFAPRPGEPPVRRLVLELMGRHSNLFLLDDHQRVITLGHQVRQSQSRVRPISTGDPWQPPPPAAGEPPSRDDPEPRWRQRLLLVPLPIGRALMGAYQGIGPALAAQLLEGIAPADQPVSELNEQQWPQLWQRWQAWLAAVGEGRFFYAASGDGWRCWSPAAPTAAGPLALNRALAGYYGQRLGAERERRRRHSLEQRLRQAIERERAQAQQQEQLLALAADSDDLQRRADALLCLPSPGRARIDEAQKLYQRARRLRRSRQAITPRLERHRQRRGALDTSVTFLEQAEGDEAQQALELELEELLERGGAAARRPRAGDGGGHPRPLELRTAAGLRLQVGRNHRQNEWISLRHARRGDLWFHAQEQPGSHVVLKASEAPAGDADLAIAADLAAHFSRARHNGRVPVVMVATDDLQRIPGAAPGTVRHRGGAVLWGEP